MARHCSLCGSEDHDRRTCPRTTTASRGTAQVDRQCRADTPSPVRRQPRAGPVAHRSGKECPNDMRFCPGNRIRHGYDLEWYRKRNPDSLDWREVECAPRVFLSNEQAIDLMIGNDMRRHTQETLAHTERTQGDVSSPVTSFFACLDGSTVAHMVDVTNTHLRERGYEATQAGEFMCFWAVIILRLAFQTTYHGVREHVDASSWASAPTYHRFKQLFSCLRLHFNGVSNDRQVCLLLSLCLQRGCCCRCDFSLGFTVLYMLLYMLAFTVCAGLPSKCAPP